MADRYICVGDASSIDSVVYERKKTTRIGPLVVDLERYFLFIHSFVRSFICFLARAMAFPLDLFLFFVCLPREN